LQVLLAAARDDHFAAAKLIFEKNTPTNFNFKLWTPSLCLGLCLSLCLSLFLPVQQLWKFFVSTCDLLVIVGICGLHLLLCTVIVGICGLHLLWCPAIVDNNYYCYRVVKIAQWCPKRICNAGHFNGVRA
jgi:hypothetical protein